MNRFHKLRRLSRQERWWLFQACLLLPLNALAVNWLGVNRCRRILAWPASRFRLGAGEVELTQARQMAAMIEVAARRGFFNASCLHRSLTLWWMLQRYGVQGDLKIGLRLNQGRCEAHAWVEYLGCVLNDDDDVRQRYSPFAGSIFRPETEIQ